MANLTYNSKIFTNVNKWDDNPTYFGILVSGKLNQLNGQDYPILDAIDIDWDGAYVKNFNTYINTTEDLINLLDKAGSTISYINENYINEGDLYEMLSSIDISYTLSYQNAADIRDIIIELDKQYNILNTLSYSLVYKSRYIQVDYNDLMNNFNNITSDLFIYNSYNESFVKIDKNDVITKYGNDVDYYRYIVRDATSFEVDINKLKETVGKEVKDAYNNITYTGLIKEIKDIEKDVLRIDPIANTAYYYGYVSYQKVNDFESYIFRSYYNSYNNTELIGKHTTYNQYVKFNPEKYTKEELKNKILYIWNDNINEYEAVLYSEFYTGQYYEFFNKIDGYGIEKEIEDLDKKIDTGLNSIFDIRTQSLDPSYISINLEKDYINKTNTIVVDLNETLVNKTTGYISNGVVTSYSLLNAFSYTFDWNILN